MSHGFASAGRRSAVFAWTRRLQALSGAEEAKGASPLSFCAARDRELKRSEPPPNQYSEQTDGDDDRQQQTNQRKQHDERAHQKQEKERRQHRDHDPHERKADRADPRHIDALRAIK
jgi:hypothetical protein